MRRRWHYLVMSSHAGFDERWPRLASRLHAMLARRQVPHHVRADVAQDTAIALLERWDDLEKKDDLWPFTATIGLNVLRNEARRAARFSAAPVVAEDHATTGSTEDAVLARDELRRVAATLGSLTPRQRIALLGVLDDDPQPVSVRMTRMRARQRLRSEVGRASAGAAVALRWLGTYSWRRLFSGITGHARQLETIAQPLVVMVVGAVAAFGALGPEHGSQTVPAIPPTTALPAQTASAVISDRAHSAFRVPARPSTGVVATVSGQPETDEPLPGTESLGEKRGTYASTPSGRCTLDGCEVQQSQTHVAAGGQTVRYRGSASVTTDCFQHLGSGVSSTAGCAKTTEVSAEFEIEINGKRHRVRAGT